MSRATHIPCSGPPGATEFAKWHLPFVGHQYGTCLMSSFWRLEFWGGFLDFQENWFTPCLLNEAFRCWEYTGIESNDRVIMDCKWYGRRWSWPNWCYVVASMCSDWGKPQTTSVRNAGLRLKFWSRDFSVIWCAVINCSCLCAQTQIGLVFFFKFPPLHICSMQNHKVLLRKLLSS